MSNSANNNSLFPLFIKLEGLQLLIVGGGNVALEKLQVVLANSPQTSVTLVAKVINAAIYQLAKENPNINLVERAYAVTDLDTADIVIVAVNDIELAKQIHEDARFKKLLVNVADKPDYCDFYLSSVVKKGNLKIAISTNGRSPTVAKRLKELFNDLLPDEIDDVLNNLEVIRAGLSGNIADKIIQLNDITKVLAEKKKE